MRTFEGTMHISTADIKYLYGNKYPLTIDCENRKELTNNLKAIKVDLNKKGYKYIKFDMNERL